jgi:Ca-activated chloride channel family protein
MQQRALRQSGDAPALTPERATAVFTRHGPGTISGRVTDEKDKPLAYANVTVVGTSWGAFTKDDGSFKIVNVPPGRYTVRATMIGYEQQSVPDVTVTAWSTATVSFKIKEKPTTLSEVEIVATRERIKTKSTQTGYTITSDEAANLPVKDITNLIALKAGVIARADGLHIRGGRAGQTQYQVDGVPVPDSRVGSVPAPDPWGGNASRGPRMGVAQAPDGTPRVPTTGGTTLPNDEVYDSMFFEHYGVNPFIPTDEDPLSTFAVDVDAASYTVMRRYLEGGHLPDKEAVRVEEFVNFFKQDYPRFDDTDFRIFIEGAPSPFGKGYQLLRIGIKAREISAHDRKQANLVFVIDVSGSMAREDRLELVKRSLRVLVDELRPSDRIGIVVYGDNGRVLLEPTSLGPDRRDDDDAPAQRDGWKNPPRNDEAPGAGRERILRAIDNLHPDGSTNAEEGLLLGYDMAGRTYRGGAINRVILCSDGVANVGQTGSESILNRVRGEAAKGIQITTIGFGMGNYNDVLMEQLADKGDGNYYYVDDLAEANRVLAENLTGTLQTIARDAKVQVEFDPSRVLRYRLLGFENRDVADRDFRNDKVDAGEIGAGHEVTALYEIKLAEGADRGRIATVRFRYARPEPQSGGAPSVREIEQGLDVAGLLVSFRDASPRFRLDAAAAEFAEILRHSFWARESRIADVVPVARAAADDLPGDEAVREFVRLVEKAVDLSDKLSPEEQRGVQGR